MSKIKISLFCLAVVFCGVLVTQFTLGGRSYKVDNSNIFLNVAYGATTTSNNTSSSNWFSDLLNKISLQITTTWNKVWGTKSSSGNATSNSSSTEGTTSGSQSGTNNQAGQIESSPTNQESISGGLTNWWNDLKAKILGSNSATITRPAVTAPSTTQETASQDNSNPATTTPQAQTQQPAQATTSAQGGSQSDQPNGTTKNPYKLEPNQFKKECGQNTYFLNWRKGGIEGKDMAAPTKGGGPEGEQNVWELPTCEELAKCHCCCNTCLLPSSLCQTPGWVFNDKGCVDKCSPVCEANCGSECKKWDKPTPPDKAPLNRDCKCNQEGCPKPEGNKCKIIIEDYGKTQVEYTKRDGNPEQYFKGDGKVEFSNGNGESNPKSKIKSEGADTTKSGWVMMLEDKPGVCCKCKQDK